MNKNYCIIGTGVAAVYAAKAIRDQDKEAHINVFGAEKSLPYNRIKLSKELYSDLRSEKVLIKKEKWYDDVTSEFKFETELEQHLLINQVDPKTQERVSSTDKMRNYGLQFQDYPYNKEFWDDYNVIKDTPIDKKILADLERIAPLEKQFENN